MQHVSRVHLQGQKVQHASRDRRRRELPWLEDLPFLLQVTLRHHSKLSVIFPSFYKDAVSKPWEQYSFMLTLKHGLYGLKFRKFRCNGIILINLHVHHQSSTLFRCPNCLAEISFKTDIENVDYQAEHGATRLFEAFKYYQEQEKAKEAKEEAEKNDPMKMLEKRTQMSRAEMEAVGKRIL